MFDIEFAFTETYQQHINDHPAIREAHCLRVLYPALFDPIREGDLFAGRLHYPLVGIGLEQASGGPGYYCWNDDIRRKLDEMDADDATRQRVEAMIEFWSTETTIEGVLEGQILPPDVLDATSNNVARMGGRLAGPLLNFAKLTRIGIPGLRTEIAQARDDNPLYEGMCMALDLLADVCRWYAGQTDDPELARVLNKVAVEKPETLREAMQLAFLYALISGVVNYGRMDVYVGDFYAADIDSGRITEAEALAYTQSLWQLIADREIVFNGRVIIGGKGRPNEANADRFALVAMEATRTVIETEPQLSLRFYDGQNPALMQKALEVIGEGRTFPMLYNDDVNVPAAANAFKVSMAEAERYLPYGCGEYALDGIAFGSPNCSLNLVKAVEVALSNGVDQLDGSPLGLQTGTDFPTFEDFWTAYAQQVEFYAGMLARRHAYEYEAENRSAAFLYVSMLYDHCIERGKSVVDGGPRYSGGIIETFGMVNAADSLTAIKTLVYDKQLMTLDHLRAALDADFAGYEREHKLLKAAPKYGNDHPEADAMMQRVSDHVAGFTRAQVDVIGLDYFLVVNINNHMNIGLGQETAASADGRKSGAPLANGNTPTAGNDTKGVTAFLNSISKPDPTLHAGYVQNVNYHPLKRVACP